MKILLGLFFSLSVLCFSKTASASSCEVLKSDVDISKLRSAVAEYVEKAVREMVADNPEYTEEDIQFSVEQEMERKEGDIADVQAKYLEGKLDSCKVASAKLVNLIPSRDLVLVYRKGDYTYHIHGGNYIGVTKEAK